jgi:hypothetical protein
MTVIAANLQWVKARRTSLDRRYGIRERWTAFVDSNEIGEVFEFDVGTSHGNSAGDRIGSCMSLEGAKKCVEARWLDVVGKRDARQ